MLKNIECILTYYASWNVNNLIKYAVNVLKDEMRFRSEYAALESSFNLNNCVTVNTKNTVKILKFSVSVWCITWIFYSLCQNY